MKIRQELVDLLDEQAGKQHSADGPVLAALAEILNRHEVMIRKGVATEIEAFAAERLRHGGSRITILQGRFEGESNAFTIAARLARGEHPAGGPPCPSRFARTGWTGWTGTAVVSCDLPSGHPEMHGSKGIRWRGDDPGVTDGP